MEDDHIYKTHKDVEHLHLIASYAESVLFSPRLKDPSVLKLKGQQSDRIDKILSGLEEENKNRTATEKAMHEQIAARLGSLKPR